jgi:hypothetical protein
MYMLCKRFHVLPEAGGLLDQDAYFVHLVEEAMSAEMDREKLEQVREKVKHGAHGT